MIDQILKTVAEYDPAVGEAMQAELARERDGLELIASENFPSEAVKVGAVVDVVVLEVDEKRHRISLSMKAAKK